MASHARLLASVPGAVAVLVFVGLNCIPHAPEAASTANRAPVELQGYVRAIQGDTLDARMGNKRVGIGIVGIQAPQGNTACGKEATAFAQSLVNDGATVQEQPGASQERYRRMYDVRTTDGRSVAEEMVTAGFARANGQGANRDRLAELEAEAKEARRGCLWSGGAQ
jgi:endonuclease YncB( thermonuclease family)